MKVELTLENFDEEVRNFAGTVLIDFYATWCGPCKIMSPIVDEIEAENPDIKVAKVDVDDNDELARKFAIMSIPTIVVFKEGIQEKKFIGVVDKQEIVDALK